MPYWDHIQRQALADILQALVLALPSLRIDYSSEMAYFCANSIFDIQ